MRLELDIVREGTGYRIKAESPLGNGSGFFRLDSSLNPKMDEIQKAITEQKTLDENVVTELGIQLFHMLFSNTKELFHKCIDQSDHLDIVLQTKEFEITILPWELAHDPEYHLFLGAHPRCSLTRRDQKSDADFGRIDYPLKVLVIISSPMDLDEKGEYQPDPDEIESLMAPLNPLVQKGLLHLTFLERASVQCIQDQLKEGYHIVHFIGHGRYEPEEGKGFLIIEDKTRNSKVLSQEEAAQLFGVNPPQLLFLTACESSPLIPFLLSARIPAALGMQFTILVNTAHYFLERFYSLLLKGDSISQAVSTARNAVLLEEGKGNTGWFTPVLSARSLDILKVNTLSVPKIPEREPERFDMDKDLIGIENFVGRRKDLWLMEKAFFEDNLKMVVITGIGGIGKSSLASKFSRRHKPRFKSVCARRITDSSMGAEGILVLLDQFLSRNGDQRLHEVIDERDLNFKLEVLNNCLKGRYLLVLDNFETLLEGSHIRDKDVEKVLQTVVFGDHPSKVIITTRYGFTFEDEKAGGLVAVVDVNELSLQAASQLLGRLGIKEYGMQRDIYRKVGGNPQFLEFFSQLAKTRSVEKLLKDITPVREKIGEWLLNELVALLTDDEKVVLKKFSVFRRIVEGEGIDVLGGSDEIVEKLVYYSLMKVERDGRYGYFMHQGVRDYCCSLLSLDEKVKAHAEAVKYYEMVVEKEKVDFLDLFERHYHLIESEQYEKAGNFVLDIFEPLFTFGFRGELIGLLVETIKTAEGRTKAGGFFDLGKVLGALGEYEEAEKCYRESLNLAESLGDKRGIASSLHQLGMLQQYQGNYKEAEKYYKESLNLAESLGDKQGKASSLHQLGRLQEDQGNYKEAEKYYKESLNLAESLGDKYGKAYSLHQLGILQHYQGNYKEAEKYYKESLNLKESLGDKQGIASSLHQLGTLQQYQGNYKEAEKYYKESLNLAESLGDKQGIASSLHQLGVLQEKQRNYKEAVEHYIISLSILSQLGSPDAETVIKSLRRVRGAIGEQFDNYWKTITNQEVPDFIKTPSELEDFIQHILYIVKSHDQEEITKATEALQTILKESGPDTTQFLHILLDILSGKDVSQKVKELEEPFKSLLQKYV